MSPPLEQIGHAVFRPYVSKVAGQERVTFKQTSCQLPFPWKACHPAPQYGEIKGHTGRVRSWPLQIAAMDALCEDALSHATMSPGDQRRKESYELCKHGGNIHENGPSEKHIPRTTAPITTKIPYRPAM
ncbi:uncharacterized protein MEPE_04716 [Melanopsichium pennsylvanicum]|uniref:Uncharacterized protein n=1 Tax=Melanopsichium pennsylvanicum TaxID=63383 RepID=A0AAJ4XQF8_9BASI|nr:uncharacterized protein MEPE_04716 [Melanopsichium pennsylvanicum]